jgi:hypothetical protein
MSSARRRFVVFTGLLGLVAVVVAAEQGEKPGKPVRSIKDGVLDQIVLYVAALPADVSTIVAMRLFSGLDADLGTGGDGGKQDRKDEATTMKTEGPRLLGERFVASLKEAGPYTNVSMLDTAAPVPAGGLLVEGRFTKIDPGSRAKRYFVGFGAGKSSVAVDGTLKLNGVTLATFSQKRIGVMGVGGGDSLGKLLSDSKDIGSDIAKFISAWAKGKSLK